MRLAISALLVSLLLSGYAQAQTPASEGSSGDPVVANDASTAGTDGSDPAQDVLDLDDFVVRQTWARD